MIPPFGILGAAIGWAVGILGSNLVPLALVWRRLGLHPFGRGTYVAYALCAACYLVLPVLAWILSGGMMMPCARTVGDSSMRSTVRVSLVR